MSALPRRTDARRPVVHVQFPSAIEATYKRKLLSRVHAAQTLLLRKLARLVSARRRAEAAAEKEAARDDAAEPDIADWLKVIEEVRVAYTAAFPPPEGQLGTLAKQLDIFTTGQVSRSIQTVAAIDIGKQPGLTQLYQTWTRGNVDLIKSIDTVHFDQIRDVVYDAVKTGKMTDRLITDLQERYSVTRSRAELIARDQVGKLNGQITMQRQVSVGVSKYKWTTSHDERVRASHRALDGEVFAWNDPPPEGHPGYPVQCRCSAIPVWDDEENGAASAAEDRRPAATYAARPTDLKFPAGERYRPLPTGMTTEVHHYTSPESAASILHGGFQPSDGMLGKGVYTTVHQVADISKATNRAYASTRVGVKVNLKNVMEVDGARGLDKWEEEFAKPGETLEQALSRNGIEGVLVRRGKDKFSPSSEDWLIVYDPAAAVPASISTP